MSDSKSEAYVLGFQAGRREGPYADPNADVRCPYVTETKESDDWQRGFDDASRAQDASS